MGLRNHDHYRQSTLYVFDTLNSWLPGRIKAMDIDGTVERNSHFLFTEFKGDRRPSMPTGQRIYWSNLIRELKGKAVLLLIGHQPLSVNTYDPFGDQSVVAAQWYCTEQQALRWTDYVVMEPEHMKWLIQTWHDWASGRKVELESWLVSHAKDN